MELTDEQERAKAKVEDYLERQRQPYLTITGYAGTGKSTLMANLLIGSDMDDGRTAVAAPTGRAAMVLTKMGCKAVTIHSLLYDPVEQPDGSIVYVKKDRDSVPFDRIFIDEAPMVAKLQHEDLLDLGIPVCYFGDNFQLKPVGEDPNILRRPDATLVQVHRQARKSPIIRLATDTRNGNFQFGKKYKESERGCVEWGDYKDFIASAGEVTQLICGFNKTRRVVNEGVRDVLGYNRVIEKGEDVICLRNNRKLGLFNGLCGSVVKVHDRDKNYCVASIKDELGRLLPRQVLYTETIVTGSVPLKIPPKKYRPDMSHWTYAYCLTGHKMQGGGVKSCAVYEETVDDWEPDRWRYTTQTRAEHKLIYCRG